MTSEKPSFYITRTFKFDAAHRLPGYEGKCSQLHGHTWEVAITLKSQTNDQGISIDFSEIKRVVNERVIKHLDHNYLNNLLEHPTAENLCRLIWGALLNIYHNRLHRVTVKESPGCWVTLDWSSYQQQEASNEH